jgi:HAD superfamily hydrolase (TIGR01450 family)
MGVCQSQRRYHLNTEEAFLAYEAVRDRLPKVTRSAPCSRSHNLEDIADQFDVFLLDAFGVLNIGETAIEGVPERVSKLQQAGKRVLVVSNSAGASHDNQMARYRRLGYRFAPEDVITSRKSILHALGTELSRQWGLMIGDKTKAEDMEHLYTTYLGDDPGAYDDAEGFLMIGSAAWTEKRQALLEETLLRRPRPVLVGNPDIVAPRETGFSLQPGYFAHRLADRTGIKPQFFGKPFKNIFELAYLQLGDECEASRVAMVGDSLHTDILGGQAAGIKSVLITGWGFFAGSDVDNPIKSSGIMPDYILERP